MNNRLIIGIDPGKNGAATFINESGEIFDIVEYGKNTEHEVADAFIEHGPHVVKAYLEFVASRPAQGVRSVFSFGSNYGFWRGLLTCLKIPYEKVTPGTWQRSLRCLSKGDKNITKAKAQQLFPKHKITHSIADSILIAEYGRRVESIFD
jgi:crossover junction endodeoxyribonuclease RuvC